MLPLGSWKKIQSPTETAHAIHVPSFSLSGWNYIDDHHILVDSGPGAGYLVTFLFPCRELAWADRIGYTTRAGTFGRMDRILVRDLGRQVSCPVGELHKVERGDGGAAKE